MAIFSAPFIHRSWRTPELSLLSFPGPWLSLDTPNAVHTALQVVHCSPSTDTGCSLNCHSLGITKRPTWCSCQPQEVLQQPATLQTRTPLLPLPCTPPAPAPGPLNSFKQPGMDLWDWQERSPEQGKPCLAVIKLCHRAGCRQKGTHNGIRIVIN